MDPFTVLTREILDINEDIKRVSAELLEAALIVNNEMLIATLKQSVKDLNVRLNATIAARDRLAPIPPTAPGKIQIPPRIPLFIRTAPFRICLLKLFCPLIFLCICVRLICRIGVVFIRIFSKVKKES